MSRRLWVAAALLLLAPPAAAQDASSSVRAVRLRSTPVGALPPLALPMPAARNKSYWAGRLVVGELRGGGPLRMAYGAGVDLQWLGGSTFGVTAGYVQRDCELAGSECGGHAMFGARARLNVITAGPTLAGLIGDYTATSTLGTVLGVGYAPGVLPGVNACTVDLSTPFSIAMLRTVRVAAFVSPGALLDIRCSSAAPSTGIAVFTGVGVAAQQVGVRGLDVHLGLRRIFQAGTGYMVGITVSYTRLP